MKIEVTYDPTIRRYRATVYNDAGATVYACVRSSRESAKWNAENYVAYREPASR